jgi:small-conductance mechanosensitive channel
LRTTVDELTATGKKLTQRLEQMRSARSLRGTQEETLASLRLQRSAAERALGEFDTIARQLAEIPELTADTDEAITESLRRMEAKAAEVNSLEATRRDQVGRDYDLQRLAEAEKNRDKALKEKVITDAAVEAIKELQKRMVRDAFEPLLTHANELFEGVLNEKLAYNDGEIGFWRGGTWSTHKTFSGTEQALAYAAIQLALAARGPLRVLVLDELGRLSDDNVIKVSRALARACGTGRIDQFVGVETGRVMLYDTGARDYLTESAINVISVSAFR